MFKADIGLAGCAISASRCIRDLQRAEDSQRRVGLLPVINGKRSGGDQCTAPISDAAIEVEPFLVMLLAEPVNLNNGVPNSARNLME